MAEINNLKSDNIRKDESIIHEQTNPSFHGTPEDALNYKSLQNNSQTVIKKSLFSLKPSLLTQKVEQIRTDKAAVSACSNSSTNKFLVLGDKMELQIVSNSDQNTDKSNVTESSDFVFGENIFSRVVKSDSLNPSEELSKQQFKDLVCNDNNDVETVDVDNEALRKSADELLQRNHAKQYDEAEVITGEEDETNVLKMLCKLFLFNSEKNEWIEKGYCNAHLNDLVESDNKFKARLVARSKGGLKVLLNTSIWADMGLARASSKAVRITAQSDDGVKSFLLNMQNSTDADSMFHALMMRKLRLSKQLDSDKDKNNTRKRECLDSSNSEDADLCIKKRLVENSDESKDNDETSDV